MLLNLKSKIYPQKKNKKIHLQNTLVLDTYLLRFFNIRTE